MTAKAQQVQPAALDARAVAGWVLAAAAVRLLAYVWAGPHLPCSYDGCSYLALAQALAQGGGWVTEKGFLWPPGYTLFLAPLVPDAGSAAPLARLLQSLLGATLVWPVALLARRAAAGGPAETGGRTRTAQHVACGLVALDPTLVAYSHLLWPETLFLLLLAPAGLLLLGAAGRPGRLLAAGAVLGAAGLVKAIGLWLAVPLALAVAPRGRRLAAAGWVLLGALLVVSPWTARNAAVYGRFLLIDATAGTNLFLGNNDGPPITWDWGAPERSRAQAERERCAEGDFIQRDRCEQARALRWMAAHPGRVLTRTVTKWADLINPTSFLVRQVRAARYTGGTMEEVSPVAAGLATAAAALPWMALALLAVLGLAHGPPGPVRRLTLALVLALLAVHALTFGMSRFRLPAVPFLAAHAGVAVAAARAGAWLPPGPRPRVVAAVVLLALLGLWGLRLGPLLDLRPLALP